jgi:hypothetical protein
MKFSDLDLRSIGQEVQLVGGIWAGNGRAYLCYFPEFGREFGPTAVEMNADDWKALLRQSDLVETEVLAKAENGDLVKAVVRKCERNISAQVSWNVFKRDNFHCRYCGRDDVPLTVDHLVLYEEGGPSIEANLLAVCKKDNKARGRMQYADWLKSEHYLRVSKNLSALVRADNLEVAETLATIPRMAHVRSR